MKFRAAYLKVWICLAVIASWGVLGCERDKALPWVLKEFETPAWAGVEGLLIVRTETEDSKVLLLHHRPMEEGLAELFGQTYRNGEYDPKEVVYRYDPAADPEELEAVDRRAWDAATGPAWWDLRQKRRVPDEFRMLPIDGKLAYRTHEVPTKGREILHMAKSMWRDGKKVAIISARRKTSDLETMKAWGKPVYKKHYHQVYDFGKLAPVGEPVPLPFNMRDQGVKGIWAGQDTYVVYTDAYHKRIFIVHMDELVYERE